MSLRKKLLLLLGILLIVVLIAGFLQVRYTPKPLSVPATVGPTLPGSSTSTADTGALSIPPFGSPKKKTLPPEQPLVLPPGGTAIDGYAYIASSTVYFRSLTGAAPLAIPDSDADTFKRLGDFVTYPGSGVVDECGASPLYTYYGDKKQVYFYQVWRTPKFRSSRIEVIIGVHPGDFEITGIRTATNGMYLFEVGYGKATTTCKLFLSRTTL